MLWNAIGERSCSTCAMNRTREAPLRHRGSNLGEVARPWGVRSPQAEQRMTQFSLTFVAHPPCPPFACLRVAPHGRQVLRHSMHPASLAYSSRFAWRRLDSEILRAQGSDWGIAGIIGDGWGRQEDGQIGHVEAWLCLKRAAKVQWSSIGLLVVTSGAELRGHSATKSDRNVWRSIPHWLPRHT